MTQTLESLRRQLDRAGQLATVVRAMKALAAVSIGQYESAVRSLGDYQRTVHLGLAAHLRSGAAAEVPASAPAQDVIAAVVFGSDQGLVGQFNDTIAAYVRTRVTRHARAAKLWLVGERVASRLDDLAAADRTVLPVPSSVTAIGGLIGQILEEIEALREVEPCARVCLYFNERRSGATVEPVAEQLLPLDARWRTQFRALEWPSQNLPEVVGSAEAALRALLREYLFVSLFRACAESLASENASRLVAMQRAERNIDTLTQNLTESFNGLRQQSIDAELFDVIAGFDALSGRKAAP